MFYYVHTSDQRAFARFFHVSYAAERTSLDRDDLLLFSVPECDRPYAFWLVSVPWIGQGPVPKLLSIFGSPGDVFQCTDKEIHAALGEGVKVDSLLRYRQNNDIFKRCAVNFSKCITEKSFCCIVEESNFHLIVANDNCIKR